MHNVFLIGRGDKPLISLPKGKGLRCDCTAICACNLRLVREAGREVYLCTVFRLSHSSEIIASMPDECHDLLCRMSIVQESAKRAGTA